MFNGGAYVDSLSLCQQSEVKMLSWLWIKTKRVPSYCCSCSPKTQFFPLRKTSKSGMNNGAATNVSKQSKHIVARTDIYVFLLVGCVSVIV